MALDFSMKGFENGLRLLTPVLLLIILFMLSVTALPLPHVGPIKPALLLMAVYYWSIYRPTMMPPWLCFVTGLLLDLLTGLPPGVNAVIFTLVQWTVRDQRKFLMGQPYITIWAVFILVAGLSGLVQWTLYGLPNMHWAPILPVIISLAATIFLFPAVTLFLIMVHHILPHIQKTYP